jgi:dihydrofolate reductase
MSRVIYSMMVSLDGFVARPNGDLDWANVDEELHTFANQQERETGTILYGRRLYELMAAYWPTADLNPSAPAVEVEYARIWRDKPKIVFSKTLEQVAWNATLMRDVVADEITRLASQPGNDLSLGGPDLAASFMRLGLIDEYRPIVHPVVLGRGIPFWPKSDTTLRLRLVETRTFASGVVYLRYQRADGG